jgi:YidC/Oxa1 family membrane protein insertase
MRILEIVLSPIVWLMEIVLEIYIAMCSSVGLSILLLSFTFALALLPLRKRATRIEQRISRKMQAVQEELLPYRGKLKGDALFQETERIYEKHGYHPIQSIGMGASFFVMLPVLISAILLFSGDGVLAGESFLFIPDLSKPDHLLGPVNVLPLLMSAITVVDAKLRFKDDKSSQYRFFLIAIVLLVIVYNLAAGLVLYWTGANLMSLVISRIESRRATAPHAP